MWTPLDTGQEEGGKDNKTIWTGSKGETETWQEARRLKKNSVHGSRGYMPNESNGRELKGKEREISQKSVCLLSVVMELSC